MNLSKNIEVKVLTSGSTNVDFSNYDGVLFFGLGTKLEVSQASSGKIAETIASDGIVYADIYRPLESQGKTLKATLTGDGDLYAILYQGRAKPEEWGTGKLFISPEVA